MKEDVVSALDCSVRRFRISCAMTTRKQLVELDGEQCDQMGKCDSSEY